MKNQVQTRPPHPEVSQARLVASARAAYARRAEIRRRLKHSNTDLRTLLSGFAQQHPDLRKMNIRSALSDLPHLGTQAVEDALTRTGVDGSKSFARLSVSEGARLADQLDN